jgi:hypothetical protein
MRVMSTDVLTEIEGTYTGKMLGEWEAESESASKYLDKIIDHKDPLGDIKGAWSQRKDMRWALWVIRRHAVWVYKPKTLKKILSLVPFAHLLEHSPRAGGVVSMGLDTIIRVRAGRDHNIGETVGISRGSLSDFESLLRYHRVDQYDDMETEGGETQQQIDERKSLDENHHPLSLSRNPFNKIIVKLPGSRGIEVEDIFFEWTSMKEWRRAMKLPPKQSDLWRIANKLQLFGEEWDEEEQKAISQANAQLIKSLPLPIDQVSAEEQLMLLGMASTAEEAALIVSGGRTPNQQEVGQLYTAPDPEEDERAAKAIEEMADAMLQLQEAVAAGPTDPSILKVINQSKDFF